MATYAMATTSALSLADPELELIDPTPNVHILFVHFDKMFFGTRLVCTTTVRWSKRMYSCAGVCYYGGHNSLCDIALSEPLLKLRPRKDLVETLLHEMIHAYLFVTGNVRDRDGHGPSFQAHMHRINKAARLNITIYHDFHDEVKLYQNHVWRCDGVCKNQAPYFGIVRRSMNRAPSSNDFWWNEHMRMCRGNFIKIMGPEIPVKGKKTAKEKSVTDLSKYTSSNLPNNTLLASGFTKTYIGTTTAALPAVTKDRPKPSPPQVFAGKAVFDSISKVNGSIIRHQPNHNIADTVRDVWLKKHQVIANASTAATDTKAVEDVTRKVREVWANKTFGNKNIASKSEAEKPNKRTSTSTENATPKKAKKIDDFFKKRVGILKDIYGSDLVLQKKGGKISTKTVSKDDHNKVTPENPFILAPDAETDKNGPVIEIPGQEVAMVECPICQWQIKSEDINQHIDECLNSQEINNLVTNGGFIIEPSAGTAFDEPLDLSMNAARSQTPTKAGPELLDLSNADTVIKINTQVCPCCELLTDKPMEEHFEECIAFMIKSVPKPRDESKTIEIQDDYTDDMFDESSALNDTGTKFPCPVCLTMIEEGVMNFHLDLCLAQREMEGEQEKET